MPSDCACIWGTVGDADPPLKGEKDKDAGYNGSGVDRRSHTLQMGSHGHPRPTSTVGPPQSHGVVILRARPAVVYRSSVPVHCERVKRSHGLTV